MHRHTDTSIPSTPAAAMIECTNASNDALVLIFSFRSKNLLLETVIPRSRSSAICGVTSEKPAESSCTCLSLGKRSARASSTTTPPYGRQTMASASARSATASASVVSSPSPSHCRECCTAYKGDCMLCTGLFRMHRATVGFPIAGKFYCRQILAS